MDPHRFLTFLAACSALALMPGPGVLYVLARSLKGGRREGVLSSLGTAVGGMGHVLAAALGLSAILLASAEAYTVVRYAGAAYLLWIGVRTILDRRAHSADETASSGHAFRQGVLTEVLNPKTALFFVSFIPQFVDPARSPIFVQFVVLGAISVTLNTLVDLLVVGLSGMLGDRFARNPRLQRRGQIASGLAMIGLGAYVATETN